jgi:hypothetical protein
VAELGAPRKVLPALLALAIAAGLGACGGDSHNQGESEDHGSTAVRAPFKLVPDAPAGYKALAGEATLKRDGGTTVSLNLTGLPQDKDYVAHLHSGSCDETDPGGPHFKFDPKGSDQPPNEIHLEFSSKANGTARATVTSKREVPVGEAGSLVVHEAGDEDGMTAAPSDPGGEALLVHTGHSHEEQKPAKIACAELEGGVHAGTHGADAGPTIVIRGGEPAGGVEELEYSAGDQIRFTVESDVADEVHVHGYDLSQDVPAGGSVDFDFAAEIEGIFEIELEQRKEQIAELRVNP